MKKTSTQNPGMTHSLKKFSSRTFLVAAALFGSFFSQSQTVTVPASGSNTVNCGMVTLLQDHAGSSDYSPNVNGFTVLNAAPGAIISLNGSYRTEASLDLIKIFNGAGTGGTQIGTSYSGTGVINFTSTPGQTITVQFLSDVSVQYFGFDLVVTSRGCGGPCSGTPASNTIVPSYTGAICPGQSMSFNLLNSYEAGITGVSGLTYQWQYSDQSAVGPFTVIPTGTLAAFTSPTLASSYYFNTIITCSNGNGSVTPQSVQVNVAGTTTNTVPYYEGFEGVAFNGQLPNCSWLNGTPANISTYTLATTGNRSANTGVKYAAINAAATATNLLYTNGIQLNAGVTYSAAMWYKTEYSSLTNFTDLSILVGMTQSTTGLVQVASSNGPAFSNNYKLLSGTFVVPSSGLYYVAMRATSNNGAFYMSIDDISVTAPCSLNSPTLAVSGGTTTCSGQVVNINAAGANTYTWSVNNLHTAAISVTPVVTANSVINYSVTGTNTLSGCTSTIVRPITVNVGPAVSVFPLNTTVCEGGSTTLYASSTNQAATFVWNTTGTPGYSTSVTPAASSVYSVNATTNANNCITTSTIGIDVVANPTVFASSTRNTVMCEGDALTLNATGATTYTWIATNTGALFIGSSVNPAPHVTTTYMVTGTDGATGCSSSANITQNVAVCVGINNISASNNEINVYPNPNNGMFTVALADNSVKTISVTDVTGRVLLTNTTSDVTVDFNINAFAAGIYYVKVQSNNKAQVLKVVKQ